LFTTPPNNPSSSTLPNLCAISTRISTINGINAIFKNI
jgi:hypothetical protein